MKFLILVLSALLTSLASATTRYVSPDATGASEEDFTVAHPGTLRNAIAVSADGTSWETGDEIVLLAGTTGGLYDCTELERDESYFSYFVCNKKFLTIRGYSSDRSAVVLKGGGESLHQRCFRCKVATQIMNLTVDGFGLDETVLKPSGGGILSVDSSYYVSGGGGVCAIAENSTSVANVWVRNCVFKNCSAGTGGALCYCNSEKTLFYECSFNYNNSNSYHTGGGAVYNGIHSNDVFDTCHSETYLSTGKSRGGAGLTGSYYGCLFTGCYCYLGMVISGATNSSNDGVYASHCVFSNNTHSSTCSGIVYTGTVEDSLFCDNTTPMNYGFPHTAVTRRCVFVRNVSSAILSGNCYNDLVVHNTCNGGGGTGASIYANLYNCTIVSNSVKQTIFGNGVTAYSCLAAANTKVAWPSLSYGDKSHMYECTADWELNTKTTMRNCTNDTGAVKGIRWGTESNWNIPVMPVAIRKRETVYGYGSNLLSDGTTPIWTAADTDLNGRPRLRGDSLDIGCYSYAPRGLALIVR